MSEYLGFRPTESSKYFFVSYSSEDTKSLWNITKKLSERIPLWYDYGLTYGKDWTKEIADHIENAEAVLLFISKQVLAKGNASYVYTEYQMAKDFFEKPIYVIQIEDIKKTDIPNELLGWWIDLRKYQNIIRQPQMSDQEIVDKIFEAVNKNIGKNFCLRDEKGTIYKLRDGINTIGSDPHINTTEISNVYVSRIQAVIEIDEQRVPYIYDMVSMSGTYINGDRIEPKTRYFLNHGDEICFGNYKLVFDIL